MSSTMNRFNVDDGINLGTDRARRYFKNYVLSLDTDARDRIERVLSAWPHDLSDNFVEVFVEMSTIASLARTHYNETPLTDDDIQAFLGHSVTFFNSLKHR
jgi:hypothetical protein